jgi:hypothetical protein
MDAHLRRSEGALPTDKVLHHARRDAGRAIGAWGCGAGL